MNSLKERFEETARKYITREGIEDLLEYLDGSDFYTAPASTIYHGSYEGGLVEHSLNVFNSLLAEVKFTYGEGWQECISLESIAIVALFHDLCKVNSYTTYMKNVKNEVTGQWEKQECYKRDPLFPMGHGDKSLFIVMNYMKVKPAEALAIKWHMGAFDTSEYSSVNELSKAYESCSLAFLLHIADMKTTYIYENEEN